MDTHTLLHLIQSPESVTSSQLETLREEAKRYPYFQALQLLIAKADPSSANIKRAAAFTADRGVLMRIINQKFNPDVNLPNIDHLDIQEEDLNAFERLGREDDPNEEGDFRSQLEALAEGEDEAVLEKDDDFDDSFGDIDFDVPDYQVDFGSDAEEETTIEEEALTEPSQLEDSPLFADSGEEEVEGDTQEDAQEEEIEEIREEEEESGIDADLLASIEAARKSREKYMGESAAWPSDMPEEEIEAQEQEADPPSSEADEVQPPPHISDEENEEVSDPDLLESLAALRRAKAEAMQKREEAEARMAAMDQELEKKIEEVEEKKDANVPPPPKMKEPKIIPPTDGDFPLPETDYPHPEFEDPFEEKKTEATNKPLTEPQDSKEAASDADLFGVDSSLFALDDWLEEDKDGVQESSRASSYEGNSGNSTAQEPLAAPADFENQNDVTNDTMTLEERIKAQSSIISSFIEKAPKIAPKQDQLDAKENETPEDLSKKSLDTAPTFVSENLASIMVRQGKYGQAIKIYQQLMLKYPEKKSYFADLIEHLENKQK